MSHLKSMNLRTASLDALREREVALAKGLDTDRLSRVKYDEYSRRLNNVRRELERRR